MKKQRLADLITKDQELKSIIKSITKEELK